MKKKKTVKPFYFTRDKEDIIDELDRDHPISIKQFEMIINRIYLRYPLIDKAQISLIVQVVFETLRKLLVFGYVLNFNKFVFDMKLHFFTHGNVPMLKVKIKTPPKLRNKQ